MANDSLKIGFIGLGALGQGLCSSLVRAGFSTTVTDLNQEAAQPLVAAGAADGTAPEPAMPGMAAARPDGQPASDIADATSSAAPKVFCRIRVNSVPS